MLDKVKHYLRIDGGDDDQLIVPLISAAKQYMLNAGVTEPEPPDGGEGEEPSTDANELSLYELAVMLYVNTIYTGGGEIALSKAMDGIILQIKDWSEPT